MRNTSETLLFKWFQQVWNNNNRSSIPELITEDCVIHGLSIPEDKRGREGFLEFHKAFTEQYTDIRINVRDVLAQDDMEAALTDVSLKDRVTGNLLSFSGLCLVRVDKGKIAEAWNHYDFLNLYQQMGYTLSPPLQQ